MISQIQDAEAASMSNAFELLSSAELAARLGNVAPERIRQLEEDGALFSILPPGCETGKAYPAFQAWPNIAGEPLLQILRALVEIDGSSSPDGFFSASSPELDGLSPIEVLQASPFNSRPLQPGALELLRADLGARLDTMYGAAVAFAADRST
jgi:hypothetical protein